MKYPGNSYKDQTPIEIDIDGEHIQNITACNDILSKNLLIGPGFTDIQVNGYGGIDYKEKHNDPLTLSSVTRLLFKE
jgi:N-acetylglucosamine-6-phosphate deacetylase